jgi:long-chain fatty acid transport protein
MKKLFSLAGAMLFTASLFAGGLVTNTNLSASWVRLPARDASTSIDAVFYNPAGLMKLENGVHFSLTNQTIWQKRKINNSYPYLKDDEYKGEIFAPVFPSFYAAYKMDKFAFSFGFNAVGGGGGATFDRGLPSFEISPSSLVPSLASQGVTEYRMEAFFEGTSVYFGYQGGVSYKINDMISVFAGVRYVTAKNTYNGYLRNIEINPGGSWMRADAFFTGAAAQVTSIKGIPSSLSPVITGGAGSLTLDQAVAGVPGFEEANKTAIVAGLAQIGVTEAQALAMDLNTISATVTSAIPTLDQTIAQYTATSTLLNDKKADVEQTATGITPIIGVNISPSENLNIGIKYEFATEMEFTNDTKEDILTDFDASTGAEITMFPDKAKFRGDMPAMLSVGVDYGISEKLRASVGTHYYFDTNANYGKKIDGEYVSNDKVIDNNFFEVAAGLEYDINDKILVSIGFLSANTGVNKNYQTDLSYSLTSNTIGLGGAYAINEKMLLNLGFGYAMYDEGSEDKTYELGSNTIPAIESYYKNSIFLAIGLDFSF